MKVELELHTKEEILAFNGFCQKLMSLREKAEKEKEASRGKVYQTWPPRYVEDIGGGIFNSWK